MVFGLRIRSKPKPFQVETKEQRILRETGKKLRAEEEKERKSILKARGVRFEKARESLGEQIGKFGRVGIQAQPTFTQEQEAIREMFGGGDKVWGYGEPVRINHDLNPRQRGDSSTAELFGLG